MLTIAYLGPEKTNTHEAAIARFGRRAKYIHAPTIDDVFHLVERRVANYGVVPVENSLQGAVTHTLDRFIDFIDTPVYIQGDIQRPIKHYLIMKRRWRLQDVKTVFSHPQALAQCRGWLSQHLPHAIRREASSTARAVWIALHGARVPAAAIGRKELASGHSVKVRAKSISLEVENRTRFLIIGRGEPIPGRRNKTSILFSLKDKPGALHDALVPFKRHGLNLTKIESRPSKRKAWEYYFFIDVEGHESSLRMKRALRALKARTTHFRILGSYPIGR